MRIVQQVVRSPKKPLEEYPMEYGPFIREFSWNWNFIENRIPLKDHNTKQLIT